MQGALVAAGRGVLAGQEGGMAHLTDLIPTVAEWLNILPPSDSP